MAGKVVLHYFNGRGKMESIRWLLAAAGIDFEENLLTTREQYLKLLADGALMFEQVPLVDIDGMRLIQTKAILKYIAEKYDMQGKDLKERAMVYMYSEGLMDLMEMIMMTPFTPPADLPDKLDAIKSKANSRYLPVYEKALLGRELLVGSTLSVADVHLMECSLMLEELFPDILGGYPNVKAFQEKTAKLPNIAKFLQPGSKRKSRPDDVYVKTVMEVLNFSLPLKR